MADNPTDNAGAGPGPVHAARRFIAHLDMDAFYASVELLRYPELRGQPVVIGGGNRFQPSTITDPVSGRVKRHFATLAGYAGRGVATTATYEARTLGVNSAMGLMKAAQLAPQAVLLPADFEQYRRHSRLFKAAVRAIAPEIEDRGIDEIYIDLTALVTGAAAPWDKARALALDIKQAVRGATGLSCSIGITPNKLLSKIASELDKPDGLTLLTEAEIPTRIWPLPPRRIKGIGPKAGARLAQLGIANIGELAAKDLSWLIAHFGKNYGAWLFESARGRDHRDIVTYFETKSISRETTFERDLHPVRDREELGRIFSKLCRQLAEDMRRKAYSGKTIGLKLRFDDFRTVTRDRTLDAPTHDAIVIRRAAGECLKRVALDRRIRLLGVRASALEALNRESAEPALPLFACVKT